MATRKQSRKLRLRQLVPVWDPSMTQMNNALVVQVLNRLGITDIGSYFSKLWPMVAMGVVVCGVGGATNYGMQGLLIGAVAGLAAPAVVIWLAITLFHIAVHLFVFAAAWAAIGYCALYVIRWWL